MMMMGCLSTGPLWSDCTMPLILSLVKASCSRRPAGENLESYSESAEYEPSGLNT